MNTSQDSILSKFLNSISNIGQGLKNIMSIKINIEENDNENYIQNIYDQTCNIFNTNKEISLIDAPSFIEDSKSFQKNNSQIKNNKQENENENSKNINQELENKMLISQDKIKNNDNNNNNDISSFNKIINEEIINTDIIKDNEDKIEIKSILLNKKRERDKKIESIINEEEKNEYEDKIKLKNSNILKQKILEKEKSYNSYNISNSNNKNNNKNKINSSLMSLSMKSLDNIKYEINQRREENLRNIEEMHKRHGLYYDYLKERQIREKILNDYYKEKAKRIAEGKLQMEMEKKKEKKNLKN